MKKISVLFFGLLFVAFSCDDEDPVYPKVETVEITSVSASNFLVKGNILSTGDAQVLEYGFTYSTNSTPDIFQGNKVVAGNTAVTGPFEKTISLQAPGTSGGYTVFVRAFLTNQKGTVYGVVKEFTVPPLVVTSVSPLVARTGDEITINGTNFSANADENTVTFNDVTAEILETSVTQLVVKVPPGVIFPLYQESNSVYVTTGGQTVEATENFRILPTVTDFSPKTGTFGTTITITGSDFYPFETSLRIGGINASASEVTQTSVTFSVPSEVTSPNLDIELISFTDVIDVPGQFTIAVPQITSVTPISGIGGTRVTITGTGFNTGTFNFTNNTVKFGTTEATAFGTQQDEIIAYVPKGLAVGLYTVSVFTGIHTVNYATKFTLTSPAITGFTPTSGIAGTYVTITGTNFGTYDNLNSVLFGSDMVELYSWDETSIIVYIPIGTPSGTVKITVNASGQSVTSTADFTIL